MTMYAWSNFPRGVDANGKTQKDIPVGSEISAADLGIDEDDWKVLVANGSVREQPYPKIITDEKYSDSPNRYYKDLLARAAEAESTVEGLNSDEMKELRDAGLTGDEETSTSGTAAKEVVEEVSNTNP